VDSKEIAFVIAGRKAMQGALARAGAVILEPVVLCEVSVHADHLGDVTGDLATHRGRIQGSICGPRGSTRLHCLLPLVEAERYQTRLSALTQGRGHFTMALSHYDQLPHELTVTVPQAGPS
jgi:elongation factor G